MELSQAEEEVVRREEWNVRRTEREKIKEKKIMPVCYFFYFFVSCFGFDVGKNKKSVTNTTTFTRLPSYFH